MIGFGAVIDAIANALEAAWSAASETWRLASEGRRPKPCPIPIPVEDGRDRRRGA